MFDAMWATVQAAGQAAMNVHNPWVVIGPLVAGILGWLAFDWWRDRGKVED